MKKVFKLLFIITIFTITFLITPYFIYFNDIPTNQNNNDLVQVFMNNYLNANEKIEVLRKELDNNDIKGILSIDVLGLNEVVVQGSDNDYYMEHDINKNSNEVGSVFIDYRNTFNSKKIIIYGHNSEHSNTSFGWLEKYLDRDFVINNPTIKTNIYGIESTWTIFSVMLVPNTTKTHTRVEFVSGKKLQEHINWMINSSIVDIDENVTINDSFLTLQTCYYEPKDSFLLINFKKVEDNNGENNNQIN